MATKRSSAQARGLSPSRKSAGERRRTSSSKSQQYDPNKEPFDDGLSVSGSSVQSLKQGPPRSKHASPVKASPGKTNSAGWKPQPKQSNAPTLSASRSRPKTAGTAYQMRAKPAWLTHGDDIDDDTPRSELSVKDVTLPFKPSVDDFLDYSLESRVSTKTTRSRNNPDLSKPSQSLKKQLPDKEEEEEEKTYTANNVPNRLSPNSPSRHSEIDSFHAQGTASTRGEPTESQSVAKENNLRLEANQKPPKQTVRNSLIESLKDKSSPTTQFLSKDPEYQTQLSKENQGSFTRTSQKRTANKTLELEPELPTVSSLLLRESAALKIQKWYRRINLRDKAGQAAMKRILDVKKAEVQNRLIDENRKSKDKVSEEMRILQRREEKARHARQKAIEEMQKSREEKPASKASKPNQEMKFLQPSGRVITKAKSIAASKQAPISHKQRHRTEEALTRPATASSVGRKVDAIFEATHFADVSTAADEESGCNEAPNSISIATGTKGGSTTFDDLMSSLKELEQQPTELNRSSVTEAWAQKSTQGTEILSIQNLPEQEQQRAPGALLSVDKLRSIMSFLDEVEQADKDAISEISQAQSTASRDPGYPHISFTEKDITAHDSASQVASEISNAITAQKMQLGDKQKTVEMLQKALNQQRDFTTEHLKGMDKEHKQQMVLQRQEYESTIQRHLSFIDQLIDDKKVLSNRCEELVIKLKDIDQKYSSKIKTMESSHSQELKKQKDVSEAAEKMRREKWIQDKTKQIKEMTVKGLEPDIQKLITKHKAEIKKLKAMQQGELLEADERAGRRYIQQIDELRRQLEEERDCSVQKERENAKVRFEKQLEQEEMSYQQQRRRLYEEVQEEKERLSQQAQKSRQEILQERDSFEQSHQHTLMSMQEEHSKEIDEQERKHTVEVKNLKEQLDIEKQQWIENFMKKQETQLLSKERELKENVREARDKEIEMVIARLESETTLAREECERAAENRIKRVRDKYESEIKDLERSERMLQEKNSSAKAKLSDFENEVIRLQSEAKLKDREVTDVKKMTEQLQMERGKVTDIIRQEFADRLVTTDEDNKRLRTEMSEMKARQRIELERMSHDKDIEMEEVHKRVRQAISKKESTMQLMRNQLQAAEKRAEHLETLLTEQRKKLLS